MFTRSNIIYINGLLGILMLIVVPGCFQETQAPADIYKRVVAGEVFDTTPMRGELLPLRNRRTGFEYRCSECHSDFTSPPRQGDMQAEHAEIFKNFNHGMNTNCMNCHNQNERDSYIGRDGEVISPEQPALLCAQCHGPTFRDWEVGIHGRQNGYWDKSKGECKKLVCIQCHDPHSPKIKQLVPDPPPSYTRFEKHRPEAEGHATSETHKDKVS